MVVALDEGLKQDFKKRSRLISVFGHLECLCQRKGGELGRRMEILFLA